MDDNIQIPKTATPSQGMFARARETLQRDCMCIGTTRVHSGRAWLVIGLVAGFAAGVILVSSSGNFEVAEAKVSQKDAAKAIQKAVEARDKMVKEAASDEFVLPQGALIIVNDIIARAQQEMSAGRYDRARNFAGEAVKATDYREAEKALGKAQKKVEDLTEKAERDEAQEQFNFNNARKRAENLLREANLAFDTGDYRLVRKLAADAIIAIDYKKAQDALKKALGYRDKISSKFGNKPELSALVKQGEALAEQASYAFEQEGDYVKVRTLADRLRKLLESGKVPSTPASPHPSPTASLTPSPSATITPSPTPSPSESPQPPVSPSPFGYQGFGANTLGAAGCPTSYTTYHVTTLSDSGAGSLREGVSKGCRYVVFDVAGTIKPVNGNIYVGGPYVTIDGFSAPSPGITLSGFGGLRMKSDKEKGRDIHDVIVRGIRVRRAGYDTERDKTIDDTWDGIQVGGGAYNVVIDHVSIFGSGDGNLDITQPGTRNVTVSWSILAKPGKVTNKDLEKILDPKITPIFRPSNEEKNMLLASRATNITLHHNIFTHASQRNPQSTFDNNNFTQDTRVTVDIRNNIIWNWAGGYGARLRYGTRGNVINNFFGGAQDYEDALIVCRGDSNDGSCYGDTKNIAHVFVQGNKSDNAKANINAETTETAAFPAPAVDIQDACAAATEILAKAGARPLDAIDERYVKEITTSACK